MTNIAGFAVRVLELEKMEGVKEGEFIAKGEWAPCDPFPIPKPINCRCRVVLTPEQKSQNRVVDGNNQDVLESSGRATPPDHTKGEFS